MGSPKKVLGYAVNKHFFPHTARYYNVEFFATVILEVKGAIILRKWIQQIP